MKIKSQKDFLSGLMFLVVGGIFAWGATNYSIGTGARMGPGYFPMLLGVLLAILGANFLFAHLTCLAIPFSGASLKPEHGENQVNALHQSVQAVRYKRSRFSAKRTPFVSGDRDICSLIVARNFANPGRSSAICLARLMHPSVEVNANSGMPAAFNMLNPARERNRVPISEITGTPSHKDSQVDVAPFTVTGSRVISTCCSI